jgi:hypothetical protein
MVRLSGGWLIRRWLARQLTVGMNANEGFFVPLPWVEAALGELPTETCRVSHVNTIVADWVSCNATIRNSIDYFLVAGDLAPLIRSTKGDPVREEARQLMAEDLDYSKTPAYETLVQAVETSTPQRRQGDQLRTVAAVQAYFERFVKLFRSIERHGVLVHSALDQAGVRFNQDRGLGIAIDADGRIHRLQGANHRWAIAQVLDIQEVPVEVRLVHVMSGFRV